VNNYDVSRVVVERLFPFSGTNIIQSMNEQSFRAHRGKTLAGAATWLRVLGMFALLCLPSRARADGSESARAAYQAGQAAQESRMRRALFTRGMELARGRLANQANDPEGLYWLAVNMGAEALERGKLSALPVVPRMEQLLLTLDKADPGFEQAGAARVLGRLYHQAPAVISVGSNAKARQFLLRAVSLAPDHPGNLAFAADFLVAHGDKAQARQLAERCLQRLHAQDFGREAKEWSELARHVVEATR
jgi:hypothetical protein